MEPTSSHHRAHLRPHAPQSHCAPLRAPAQIISLPARHSSTRFQQARALHHSHVRQSQLSLLCALNPHLLHRCNSPFRMQHADNSPPRRLVCNSFPASDWTPVSIALTTISALRSPRWLFEMCVQNTARCACANTPQFAGSPMYRTALGSLPYAHHRRHAPGCQCLASCISNAHFSHTVG